MIARKIRPRIADNFRQLFRTVFESAHREVARFDILSPSKCVASPKFALD
jgi:hypothetical protein